MSGNIRTRATHQFQIEPDHEGGRKQSVTISKDRILPVPTRHGRKKALPPDKYLLIGFDTEYQTIAAVDVTEVRRGDAEARNTVLSYQYCVKLVEKDGGESRNLSVSGIIIPRRRSASGV